MQVAKPQNIVRKSNTTLNNVAKNTTCSGGWLRLVMQCIFGAITILSFILIVYTTIRGSNSNQTRPSPCTFLQCRVVCYTAPFFHEYEDDVLRAVSDASSECDALMLTLTQPYFLNSTVPSQWLSNMRTTVRELEIVGGNLRYFAPQAFVTPFAGQLKALILEDVVIMQWTPGMLMGLSNLKQLIIRDSYILNVERNALDVVDETLEVLSITGSGYFDPVNLTGGLQVDMKVKSVILSSNNFNNILTGDSFKNLRHCRALYLNSCRISSLGEGIFDHFDEIEVIYLNNNYLVAIPTGIFNRIMTLNDPRPRISLQNNLWFCDCAGDIRRWVSEGILLVDPTCYYPQQIRNQLFSDFINECDNSIRNNYNTETRVGPVHHYTGIIRTNGSCRNNSFQYLVSPIEFLSCTDTKNNLFQSIMQTSDIIKSIDNELLRSRFAIRTDYLSVLEIATAGPTVGSNYGLVWFQSECPDEIYCLNTMPSVLQVYDINNTARYTFCPILVQTGEVYEEKCIMYTASSVTARSLDVFIDFLSYSITVVFCVTIGACIVYGVIRKFPHLLKGSDRILFVKHKNVDALVLPPKVPLRLLNDDSSKLEFNNEIFTLSKNMDLNKDLVRSKSRSSTKSIAPSYISALQPTEEQLTEWRLRLHFDNDVTSCFDAPYALKADEESIYCSISGSMSSKTYESLK